MAIFRQGPPNRGHAMQQHMNNRYFRPISPVILEMIQDGVIVILWNANGTRVRWCYFNDLEWRL